MRSLQSWRLVSWPGIAVILCLLLGGVIYLPGIAGPYVFDDTANLLSNDYVKLRSLDFDSLWRAAYSMRTGPLQRPLAMTSLALNHYVAGGLDNPVWFKAVNIGIHAVNGLLVLWLLRLILARLSSVDSSWKSLKRDQSKLTWIAAGIALLWIVHPIQLTSVLYIIQRMVSLSALFTLLGLICYLKGRLRTIAKRPHGHLLATTGLLGFGTLGILSKENAVLIIPLAALLELTLFRHVPPLSSWSKLPLPTRRILLALLTVTIVAFIVWAVQYTGARYGVRPFTQAERLLTEARVLWFYIFLILVPGIDRFGLNHDDFALSTSLWSPWTTLPAVLGLLALLATGLVSWKKRPLLTLGVLWFFVGHLLESTIIALELVHEHRNYLPSLGVLLVIAHGIHESARRFKSVKPWILVPVLVVIFASVTTLRSAQWSDMYSFALFEVRHHPDSARAHTYLGWVQAKQRQYDDAMVHMREAARLDPGEAVYYINMHMISARSGIELAPHEQSTAIELMTGKLLSSSTVLALQTVDRCLLSDCTAMQGTVERWMRAALDAPAAKIDRSFFFYMLGRSLTGQGNITEAVAAFRQSHELDRNYLHPLFEIADIRIRQHNLTEADRVLAELRKANDGVPYPRTADIELLARRIEALRYDLNGRQNG